MSDKVSVDKQEYDELLLDQKFLRCLQACGVDNYEGYEDAQDMFQSQQ